jgi:hypothetical protein
MPVSVAPQYFLLGHQPAEVTCRALITGPTGNRQHPLVRHLALRLLNPSSDQLGERIDIAWSRFPWPRPAGLGALDDPLDRLMRRAPQRGRAPREFVDLYASTDQPKPRPRLCRLPMNNASRSRACCSILRKRTVQLP